MARTKSTGGVRKRGQVWSMWYYVDGQRVDESAQTGDKREALARLALRRQEVRDGTWQAPSARTSQRTIASLEAELAAARAAANVLPPAPSKTVEGYLAEWVARRETEGVRNVRNEERFFLSHVNPVIGHMDLEAVTRMDVRRIVNELGAKKSDRTGDAYAPRTILHVYRVLATALNDAVTEGLLAANPCTLKTRRGELPKKRDKELRWRAEAVYTREEAESLISDERIPLDRRTFYALMFLTGMRSSEAAGRLWRDYDATAEPLGKMTVCTQADGGSDEHETKTGDYREVPVHPTLAAILAEWRLSGFPMLFGRAPRPDDPIVPSRASTRTRMRFRANSTRYQRLEEDIELLGMRSPPALQHSIRATFLSLLEIDGANMGVVRRATHGAPSDVLGGYLRPPWPDQCRELGKLRLQRRGRAANVIPLERVSAASGDPALAVALAGGPRRPKTSTILVGDAGFEPAASSV